MLKPRLREAQLVPKILELTSTLGSELSSNWVELPSFLLNYPPSKELYKHLIIYSCENYISEYKELFM